MTPERRELLFRRVERAPEVPMLVLAVIFLAIFVLPEMVDLPADVAAGLDAVAWLIWGVFAFELVAKTYLSPDRRRYVLTHWVDVVTVLVPFLRPLRLLGLIVVGLRMWEEARTVLRRQTFGFIGVSSIVALAAASTMVYLAERGGEGPIQTYADALWWAAATITTVGYGDVYPKTPAGRGAAVVLMLIGISMFGLLTARVAALFVESEEDHDHATRLRDIQHRLERIEELLAGDAHAQASELPQKVQPTTGDYAPEHNPQRAAGRLRE